MSRTDVKIYGDIKLYAGTGNPALANKIADYLGQRLSGRQILEFPGFDREEHAPGRLSCGQTAVRRDRKTENHGRIRIGHLRHVTPARETRTAS